MIYLLPILLLLIGIYRYDYRKSLRGKFFFYCFICIILICIAGFRYKLGFDTIQYMKFYDRLSNLSDLKLSILEKERYAPGFIFIASLCKSISKEFLLLQLVTSLIINATVFYFFWNNTKNVFFGILLYYIFMYINLNMEVVREALAACVFLLSWPFFRDGKWLIYFCLALCALLFHISSVFMFLLPLICLPGIRTLFIYGNRTWIIGCVLLILGLTLSYLFIDYIKLIAITETVIDRVNTYADTKFMGKRTMELTGVLRILIRFVLYPSIAMYFVNKKLNLTKLEQNTLRKEEMLTVLSIYISLLSAGIFILARYNNYLFFFPLLIMSDWVFSYFKLAGKKIRLQFLTWIIIFLPLFIFNIYYVYNLPLNREGKYKTYMAYYPYSNYISQEKNEKREQAIRINNSRKLMK